MRLKLVHSILAIGILLCTHNSLVCTAQGTDKSGSTMSEDVVGSR